MQNSTWKSTGYHDNSTNGGNPFQQDIYYHIGFLNQFSGTFHYQGIYQYDQGFKENGYNLKPFPTHYILIETPKFPESK